jgi:WD40 repeat protein
VGRRDGPPLAILAGHQAAVWSAAFSADSRRVVTSSSDGTTRLWDTERKQPLITLAGHQDWVQHAAFSPDGRRIVTTSLDKTARLWDAETGQELAILAGIEDAMTGDVIAQLARHIGG